MEEGQEGRHRKNAQGVGEQEVADEHKVEEKERGEVEGEDVERDPATDWPVKMATGDVHRSRRRALESNAERLTDPLAASRSIAGRASTASRRWRLPLVTAPCTLYSAYTVAARRACPSRLECLVGDGVRPRKHASLSLAGGVSSPACLLQNAWYLEQNA